MEYGHLKLAILASCVITNYHYYYNHCALLLSFSVGAVTITVTKSSAFQLGFFAFAPTTTAFQASATN